ncbi:MAG TPA: hypothetical protein VGO11_10090 [Chthoniobacteraceae bacterium]|jgi:hypothetical protein|nr:hypothetical protein [Chthoniobacteraceae bacterium]
MSAASSPSAVEPWPKPASAPYPTIRFEVAGTRGVETHCFPWSALGHLAHTIHGRKEALSFEFTNYIVNVVGSGLGLLLEEISMHRIKLLRGPARAVEGERHIEITKIWVYTNARYAEARAARNPKKG